MDLISVIDHTILNPDCEVEEIKKVCSEAMELGLSAVCVPPYFAREATRVLQETNVKVATAVGFPFGYSATPAKVEEVKRAIDEGVDEIEMVVNILAIRQGNWSFVKNDIESVTLATHSKGKMINIIFEMDLLSEEEIEKLCNICIDLKVDSVKTSTGIHGKETNVEQVSQLRGNLPESIKINASGEIDKIDKMRRLLEAGADRIGTSFGVTLAKSATSESQG